MSASTGGADGSAEASMVHEIRSERSCNKSEYVIPSIVDELNPIICNSSHCYDYIYYSLDEITYRMILGTCLLEDMWNPSLYIFPCWGDRSGLWWLPVSENGCDTYMLWFMMDNTSFSLYMYIVYKSYKLYFVYIYIEREHYYLHYPIAQKKYCISQVSLGSGCDSRGKRLLELSILQGF